MRKLIILTSGMFTILGGSAAIAQEAASTPQSYPLCSKTVRDECMNPSQARGEARMHRTAHRTAHHHHKAKPA